VLRLTVTHPNPYPTATFDNAVSADRQFGGNSILTGHGDANALTVVGEAVITAHENIIDHGAEGQRVSTVRALVTQRNDAATSIAIQRHRLSENCSRNWSLGEFRGERRDIPVLVKIHVPPGFKPRFAGKDSGRHS
jgi:hypothetical protein